MVNKKANSSETHEPAPWSVPFAPVQGFTFAPELITESTRFWAQRLHAYADWMTTMAQCTTPTQMMEAQSRFIARAQQDYVSETAMLAKLASKGASGGAVGG